MTPLKAGSSGIIYDGFINHDYLVNIFIRRLLDQGVEKYGKNALIFFV